MTIRVGFGVTVLNKAMATGGIDGIGTYTRELLKEFSKLNDSVDVHPFTVGINYPLHFSGETAPYNLGNFRAQVLLSSVFGNAFLGSKKFTRNLDLIHATDHYIPRVKRCPLVATLMDAIPISHPEWVTSDYRKTKNFFWKKTARWADQIITISKFSRQQISEHFNLPLDTIANIPLGVDVKWFRKVSDRQIKKILERYQLPGEHFLSVGTLQPRKNVERSVEAYMDLPLSFRQDHPFVIVGRSGWGCQKLVESLEKNKYGNSVRWMSHLPEEELFALVKSAKALVFPTLFEGFGLPVLEAFAAGLPVISSNTSSIPEVAGDAAILIDPYNPQDIASAMLAVVNDVDLFVDLSNKGFNRAKEFTWKRTALETLKLYSHVLDLN